MKKGRIIFADTFTKLREELANTIASLQTAGIVVICDENTKRECYPQIVQTLSPHEVVCIAPGEGSKSLETLTSVFNEFARINVNRQSLIINLGGGVVTDLGGLAASCYHRGILFLNIPTTLLGMVDAAIGGKNGINFAGSKNQIGTIAHPVATIICPQFTDTISKRERLSGYGEICKMLVLSRDYASLLESDLNMITADIIRQSALTKAEIVEKDTFGDGVRNMLNLGHTYGHAFEALALSECVPIPHGTCVAWGICVALELSRANNGFDEVVCNKVVRKILNQFGLIPLVAVECLAPYLSADKRNMQNGCLDMILLDRKGFALLNQQITLEQMSEAISNVYTIWKKQSHTS